MSNIQTINFNNQQLLTDVILFLESQKYVLESDFELGFGSKLIEAFKNR